MDELSKGGRPLVCVFDSGIGGLNLLSACVRRLPQADYCYFADNYFVPYGNMAEGEVKKRVFGFFSRISALRPDAAVVACNTVTAECISALRAAYDFPILGMEPAVKQAYELGGRYLVLATKATCRSASFARLISLYGKDAKVVPLEHLAGDIEREIFSPSLSRLAEGLPKGNYRSVVLGCTHYVFIKNAIKARYGVPVFDGMAGTADHLAATLGIFDHFLTTAGKIDFFCGNFAKNRAIFEMLQQNLF